MDDSVDSAELGLRVREFELARELPSVALLNGTLDRWLPACGVPEPVLRALQVCCDEILANAVHHAGAVREPIFVRVALQPDRVQAQFAYRAFAFRPDRQERPNTHTPISLRDIGGLGIHLIKSLTDHFEYHYRDGHHCLQFEKRHLP